MGIMDKLKFWKKDDFDFDSMASKDMGMDDMPLHDNSTLGQDIEEKSPFADTPEPTTPSYAAPQQSTYQQPQPNVGAHKDMELINSKLDTIRAMLQSIEQRVANVEQATGVKQQQRLW